MCKNHLLNIIIINYYKKSIIILLKDISHLWGLGVLGFNNGGTFDGSAAVGYHAKFVREGRNGGICGKFIDQNNQFIGNQRMQQMRKINSSQDSHGVSGIFGMRNPDAPSSVCTSNGSGHLDAKDVLPILGSP